MFAQLSQLSSVDPLIILGYFVFILLVGLGFSFKAAKSIDHFFLGDRKLPGWLLGISGAVSNFDIAGTTVITAFIYMLGLRGCWITMRGGAALPLAFSMVFLARWYRRSRVMTEAEFMTFRFGDGPGGRAARMVVALAQLGFCLGMVIYFSRGVGYFVSQLLPLSALTCSTILVGICTAYTIMSGFYGVVFTDLIQGIIIAVTAGYIGTKAYLTVGDWGGMSALPAQLQTMDLPLRLNVPGHPEFDLFAVVIGFFVLKGIMEGLGGIGGYMSQRYYAARNEKEAGTMHIPWIVFLGLRWVMIAGLVVLGHALVKSGHYIDHPEMVLNMVWQNMLPAGIKGIAIAGLLAAAMSTFDSTINAGASYWTRDIYQAFINPEADQRQLVSQGRFGSAAIAFIGFFLSMSVPNINWIWTYFISCVGAALFVPMILRWYWGRFNGWGFTGSVAAGFCFSLALRIMEPVLFGKSLPMYISFALVFAVTLMAAFIVTSGSAPTDPRVLERFYRTVRPGGAWGPVRRRMEPEFIREVSREHRDDCLASVLALLSQLSIFFGAMTVVFHDWEKANICLIVLTVCVFFLYPSWYRNLRGHDSSPDTADFVDGGPGKAPKPALPGDPEYQRFYRAALCPEDNHVDDSECPDDR